MFLNENSAGLWASSGKSWSMSGWTSSSEFWLISEIFWSFSFSWWILIDSFFSAKLSSIFTSISTSMSSSTSAVLNGILLFCGVSGFKLSAAKENFLSYSFGSFLLIDKLLTLFISESDSLSDSRKPALKKGFLLGFWITAIIFSFGGDREVFFFDSILSSILVICEMVGINSFFFTGTIIFFLCFSSSISFSFWPFCFSFFLSFDLIYLKYLNIYILIF